MSAVELAFLESGDLDDDLDDLLDDDIDDQKNVLCCCKPNLMHNESLKYQLLY
jgi:hypothetical protein